MAEEKKTLCLADTSTADPTCCVVVVYRTVCVTVWGCNINILWQEFLHLQIWKGSMFSLN